MVSSVKGPADRRAAKAHWQGVGGDRGPARVVTDAMWAKIQAVQVQVDTVARELEVKWGVGRLPGLVRAEIAERFFSQAAKFAKALAAGSPADVEIEGGRMLTAWRYLDAEAEAKGAAAMTGPDGPGFPVLEGLHKDGSVMMVVASHLEARTLAKWREGHRDTRKGQVWSVGEIVGLLEGIPELGAVGKAKEVFGDAAVVGVRSRLPEREGAILNDDLPWD